MSAFFTLQPTTTITIGESVYTVADYSDSIRSLVALYDQWRQDEVDTTNELQKVKAALHTLEQQLVQQLQAEVQEREAQASQATSETSTPSAEA